MVFIAGFRNWQPGESLGPVQLATIIALWGLVISAVYMLRAYRRIFQGPEVQATSKSDDLSRDERPPAVFLAFVLLLVGLFPNLFLGFIDRKEEEPSIDLESITSSINVTRGGAAAENRLPAPGN